jgi:hypothetical protein
VITENERRHWGESETDQRRDAWEELLLDIDERISLTATEYNTLSAHYDAVGTILEDPNDPALGDLLVFPQGSFSTRTVTRPPGRDDVDIDAIAYGINGTDLAPVELLDRLYGELAERVRTGGSVKTSKRCVVIQYANEQVPCHLDVTPAVARRGNSKDDGGGLLVVPDRPTASWSPSNPRDYAEWFEGIASLELNVTVPAFYRQRLLEKRATEPLPSHEEIKAPNGLRVAVRLMKRHRDLYVERTNRTKFKPISIVISTLAALAYERVAKRSLRLSLSPIQVITEVVDEMASFIDTPATIGEYRVENPRDPSENFAEKWNENELLARTFFDWRRDLAVALRYGYINFPSRDRFRTELVEKFGVTAGPACDEHLSRNAGGTFAGLSSAASTRASQANASAAALGLGRSEPTAPAKPKPLKRLG